MNGTDQLNRDSKVPLYHQLYELLRGNIIGGKWQPGTMLPPESALCRNFHVSQITVRQALENLVNDGLIYRQRGRGSFVAQPAIESSLTRIISFTEDMNQRGCVPSSRVIDSRLVEASSTMAKKLEIGVGEVIAQLNRLRFANQEPLSIERSSFVYHYCPGVLSNDYEKVSLRQVLSGQYGIQLVKARQSIRAVLATKAQAEQLAIEPNAALLAIDRVSFSQHNVPIEYLQIFYNAKRYVLYTELQG